MKNPINYRKEDIYIIAGMACALHIDSDLHPIELEFVEGLINCLTPEEREAEEIQDFMYYVMGQGDE